LVHALAEADHYDERQHDQGHMPPPAVPGAGFIVVEPKLVLGALETVVNDRTAALDLDQPVHACAGRAPSGEERKLAVGQANDQNPASSR
jgi:hypothetical protein